MKSHGICRFSLEPVRLVEQNSGAWQDIRLARNRDSAVSSFLTRLDLVREIIRHRVSQNRIAFFVDVIRNWPNGVLALEPDEVLGGYSISDDENRENVREILRLLSDPGLTPDTLVTATQAYSPISDHPDRWEVRIFGYTYGDLASQKWIQHCDQTGTFVYSSPDDTGRTL